MYAYGVYACVYVPRSTHQPFPPHPHTSRYIMPVLRGLFLTPHQGSVPVRVLLWACACISIRINILDRVLITQKPFIHMCASILLPNTPGGGRRRLRVLQRPNRPRRPLSHPILRPLWRALRRPRALRCTLNKKTESADATQTDVDTLVCFQCDAHLHLKRACIPPHLSRLHSRQPPTPQRPQQQTQLFSPAYGHQRALPRLPSNSVNKGQKLWRLGERISAPFLKAHGFAIEEARACCWLPLPVAGGKGQQQEEVVVKEKEEEEVEQQQQHSTTTQRSTPCIAGAMVSARCRLHGVWRMELPLPGHHTPPPRPRRRPPP